LIQGVKLARDTGRGRKVI